DVDLLLAQHAQGFGAVDGHVDPVEAQGAQLAGCDLAHGLEIVHDEERGVVVQHGCGDPSRGASSAKRSAMCSKSLWIARKASGAAGSKCGPRPSRIRSRACAWLKGFL